MNTYINKKEIYVIKAILIAVLSLHLIFSSTAYVLFANEEAPGAATDQTNVEDVEENITEETLVLEEELEEDTSTEGEVITGDADALSVSENTVNINDISTDEVGKESKIDLQAETILEDEVTKESDEATSTQEQIDKEEVNQISQEEDINEDEHLSSTTPKVLPSTNNQSATSTETKIASTTPKTVKTSDPDVYVENDNEADIKNSSVTSAETGNNEAGDGGVIQTGNAYAEAQLVNVANLNLVNSTGFFSFLHNLFNSGTIFDIDLRNHPFFSSGALNTNGPCSVGCGSGGDLSVDNNNNAHIVNNVEVYAGTGNNLVGENGSIQTGNAYASANVINVANTNIIDSNYLFLVFNSFSDWDGDLVFPSQNLFSNIFTNNGGQGAGTETEITNINNATFTNNVSAGASTGGNQGEGGTIHTGGAASDGSISNIINTNITSTEPFFTMIRLNGDWSGTVYGIPPGMNWDRDGDMIYIYSDSLFGDTKGSSSKGAINSDTNISNNNNAYIENNISVTADTGGNVAGENSSIQTGNAYASANVINVANTNIIGRNVMFSIFNVLGSWSGDISFGRPDLFIGGLAEVRNSNPTLNHQIIYHLKVINNGDLKSTNTQITVNWPDALWLKHSNFGYVNGGDGIRVWNIGDIEPGESREVYITTALNAELPYGKSEVILEAEVSSNETDNNINDNTEFLTFNAFREKDFTPNGEGPVYTAPPMLRVEKFASATSTTASSTVDYKVVINNNGGGSAYDAVLIDTLTDENGNVIHEEAWEFGEIFAYEEITVEYSVFYNKDTKEGDYTNSATVYALGGHPEFKYGYYADSKTIQTKVFVKGLPKPAPLIDVEVLEDIQQEEEIKEQQEEEPLPALPFFKEETIKREILEVGILTEIDEATKKEILKYTPYFGNPMTIFTGGVVKGDFSQGAFVAASTDTESGETEASKLPLYAVAVFVSMFGALRTKGSRWMLL